MTTQLLQTQTQMLKPMFPLALATDLDSISIQHRNQALLDTGFDGYVIINQHIATILKPKIKGQKRVNVGSNQNLWIPVFDTVIVFETLDKDYAIKVEGLLFKDEPTAIIGSKLIEELCRQQNWHLLFNYVDKIVAFIERN